MHRVGRTFNFLIWKLVVRQDVKENADIRQVESSTWVAKQGVNNFWVQKNSLLRNILQGVRRW
jgi:hypothetical protein